MIVGPGRGRRETRLLREKILRDEHRRREVLLMTSNVRSGNGPRARFRRKAENLQAAQLLRKGIARQATLLLKVEEAIPGLFSHKEIPEGKPHPNYSGFCLSLLQEFKREFSSVRIIDSKIRRETKLTQGIGVIGDTLLRGNFLSLMLGSFLNR